MSQEPLPLSAGSVSCEDQGMEPDLSLFVHRPQQHLDLHLCRLPTAHLSIAYHLSSRPISGTKSITTPSRSALRLKSTVIDYYPLPAARLPSDQQLQPYLPSASINLSLGLASVTQSHINHQATIRQQSESAERGIQTADTL